MPSPPPLAIGRPGHDVGPNVLLLPWLANRKLLGAAQEASASLPAGAVPKPQGLPGVKLGGHWAIGSGTYSDSGFSGTTVGEFVEEYGFSGANASSLGHSSLQKSSKNRDCCIVPFVQAMQNLAISARESIASLFGVEVGSTPQRKLLSVFNTMPLEEKARIIDIMRKNAIDKGMALDLTDAYFANTVAPQLIDSALNKTIDASGAKLIFINTFDGVFLIVAHNQRKGQMLQASNGTTWCGESMADSSNRYFLTELSAADIPKNPIVATALDQPLEVLTKNALGTTPQEMVTRILTGKDIYMNASATYFSSVPIAKADLDDAVQEINGQLSKICDLYQDAKQVFEILRNFQNKQLKLTQEELSACTTKAQECVKPFLNGGDFRNLVPQVLWDGIFEPYQVSPPVLQLLMNVLKHGVMELSQNTHISALSESDLITLVNARNAAYEARRQGNLQPLEAFEKHTFDAGFGFVGGYLQRAEQAILQGQAPGLAAVLANLKPSYPELTKMG